jgi:hypothetical protein
MTEFHPPPLYPFLTSEVPLKPKHRTPRVPAAPSLVAWLSLGLRLWPPEISPCIRRLVAGRGSWPPRRGSGPQIGENMNDDDVLPVFCEMEFWTVPGMAHTRYDPSSILLCL